ncbi:MAG: adenosine kinase [Gammaproteobacteria bacterium]|nr:adenosine kinase [Gammaproteobacteria bacterium]MBT7538551.1 adenosine kinase [Gammaproteobacteria bacterium]MDA7771381.1 adenosine kinase [Pseudomonadales bacterium]MDC1018089.1 adenosine kinase [Pseudomonadales bacterium]
MKKYDIYGIGNALVDTEYEVDDAFISKAGVGKGLMTLIDSDERKRLLNLLEVEHEHRAIKQAGGGSAANTMVAAAQLGANSFYSCKVASDETGDFFMSDLKIAGVDTNLDAGREEGITGKCISMVTPDAERTMTTNLGISETLSPNELNREALRNSTYLYIEGYLVTSPTAFEAVKETIDIAKEAGVQVSLTLSDPAMVENFKASFDALAELGIDLIFCNEDEARLWTAASNRGEAMARLKTVCGKVVMTCGKEGALVFDGSEETMSVGIPTKAVDTTGAGDIFAGTFLFGLTHGMSFPACADLANKAASLLVSSFGARADQAALRGLL